MSYLSVHVTSCLQLLGFIFNASVWTLNRLEGKSQGNTVNKTLTTCIFHPVDLNVSKLQWLIIFKYLSVDHVEKFYIFPRLYMFWHWINTISRRHRVISHRSSYIQHCKWGYVKYYIVCEVSERWTEGYLVTVGQSFDFKCVLWHCCPVTSNQF